MIVVAAVLGVVVIGVLTVFQLALAGGAPWWRLAWGGSHRVLPTGLRVGSVVSVLVYAAVALVLLQGAGAVGLVPERAVGVALWVLTGYFTLGVVMNAVSRSRPERMVMTPVALVLAVVCLVLALH